MVTVIPSATGPASESRQRTESRVVWGPVRLGARYGDFDGADRACAPR